MPKLLLNLRLAEDDEAEEIRALLDAHALDWYETQSGFWGISAGGIWLRDLERAAEVKALLDDYQRRRCERVRAERAAAVRANLAPTFISELRADPRSMLLKLSAALLLIALTIAVPFLLLADAR
ncbi:MAG: hypothetical protein IT479_16180 [Xanthomonadales bacterium]|nr:hypothetical protein [Xanthomonadales bacterium]MCC6594799.1 hypothetical protein [Xanthomonadales bacterium]MCE7929974.1 hypothetical protein [Xanthomonadales bacterium PRO6]